MSKSGMRTQTALADTGSAGTEAGAGKQADRVQDAASGGSAGSNTANMRRVTGAAGTRSQSDAGVRTHADAGVRSPADADVHNRSDAEAQAGTGSAQDASVEPAADRKRCRRLPSEQDESFCYDFESGARGPNNGATYDLWPTPQLPLDSQLTVAEQPGMTQNHVLLTKPSLLGGEAAASLSHSVRHFDSGTVEFAWWANDAVIQASDAVSVFRFVPIDENYEQVTALYFRRGQGVLRSESGDEEHLLSRLPRTDGKPTHVSVHLERGGECSAEVRFDGELVASAPAGACALERESFVEFGLYMRDRESGDMTASYDDIEFRRE